MNFARLNWKVIWERTQSDQLLLAAVGLLLLMGLVMVTSASLFVAENRFGDAWMFAKRQLLFAGLGVAVMVLVTQIPLKWWQNLGPVWLIAGLGLLATVFIPGLGVEVNGSQRWLLMGPLRIQPAEPARLLLLMYLASYLVRHAQTVAVGWRGFAAPIVVLLLASALLLMQPDFGATAVLWVAALSMMFVAGARLLHFAVVTGLGAVALAVVAVASPYRVQRLTSFLDPWADPYNNGFQLVQALIAVGRGELSGVGIGNSVQKLLYLPEAHTDFLFSILAEETGLVGCCIVVAIYVVMLHRGFAIADRAAAREEMFAAYIGYGVALLLGMQAFVNIGVNIGILPTKGLPLPFMSYGGSSLLIACVSIGLLLRVAYENAWAAVMAAPGAESGGTNKVSKLSAEVTA